MNEVELKEEGKIKRLTNKTFQFEKSLLKNMNHLLKMIHIGIKMIYLAMM